MKALQTLDVFANIGNKEFQVGTAYLPQRGEMYWQYDDAFLNSVLEISPIHLALKQKLHKNPGASAEADFLPGVFLDCLPSGWGKRVMDQAFQIQCVGEVSVLDRLAYMGSRSIGAFRFVPEKSMGDADQAKPIELEQFIERAYRFIRGEYKSVNRDVIAACVVAGGELPKAAVGYNPQSKEIVQGGYDLPPNFVHYLLKFDPYGAPEFAYSQMARAAQIAVPNTVLIERGPNRFFAAERFDRKRENEKVHVHSLSGLLNLDTQASQGEAVASYDHLIKVVRALTRDKSQVLEAYKRMVFNVYACVRNDHPDNFSFLMDGKGKWSLAPAYDLNFDNRQPGHFMLVNGKAVPSKNDFLEVANRFELGAADVKSAFEGVEHAISQWSKIASDSGVDPVLAQRIDNTLQERLTRGGEVDRYS